MIISHLIYKCQPNECKEMEKIKSKVCFAIHEHRTDI